MYDYADRSWVQEISAQFPLVPRDPYTVQRAKAIKRLGPRWLLHASNSAVAVSHQPSPTGHGRRGSTKGAQT